MIAPELEAAIARRAGLRASCHAAGTDCYRLFHGIAEGDPGLAIDRYGPLVLVQTFRAALPPAALADLQARLRAVLEFGHDAVWVHRGEGAGPPPDPAAERDVACHEHGAEFVVRARHRGQDPWLFLDFRAGRRWLAAHAAGRSVLNLFAYTCTAGVAAARAGAAEVWNVDFARSHLEVGARNAERNGVTARMRFLAEDALAVLRALAGTNVGRYPQRGRFPALAQRRFDLVVLDPPPFAKGRFGTVDVARDYQSLFKPAVLATEPGGFVLATNNLASVPAATWLQTLERCAAKAGRPLRNLEVLVPDADFPSFDGTPPLKIAVCAV